MNRPNRIPTRQARMVRDAATDLHADLQLIGRDPEGAALAGVDHATLCHDVQELIAEAEALKVEILALALEAR